MVLFKLARITSNTIKCIKYLIPQVMVTHGTEAVHALINIGDWEEITGPALVVMFMLRWHSMPSTHNGITALANILKSPIARWPLLKV